MSRCIAFLLGAGLISQSVFLMNLMSTIDDGTEKDEEAPAVVQQQQPMGYSTVERITTGLDSLSSNDIQKRSCPTVIEGFNYTSAWADRSRFLDEFQGYPQYVKGIDVQPLRDSKNDYCVAPTHQLVELMTIQQDLQIQTGTPQKTLNFFTNNQENVEFLTALSSGYNAPSCMKHVKSFQVFSALPWTGSHPFHKHGEAWIGAVSGYKTWWFLPPSHEKPPKTPACLFKDGTEVPPEGTLRMVQRPGDVVHVPAHWWHATCADSDWTVGIGAQNGDLRQYQQDFAPVSTYKDMHLLKDEQKLRSKIKECGLETEAATRVSFRLGQQSSTTMCAAVKTAGANDAPLKFKPIEAELRTGHGKNEKMKCISGWYCCNRGTALWDDIHANRTDTFDFLKLPRNVFGHYLDSFVKHLNDFYKTLPEGTSGKFLDIGATGSVASGMTQATSKFAHWSGPFDYWILDSDSAAKKLDNAIVCDIDDCPEALDCGYDVTFSHTVLEHAARPWKSFDSIARITKRGGLTLHLVPWSYQYHATPGDYYRFSHTALRSLLEDRGFEVLDVGYDICSKPEHVLKTKKDEHFDVIWLTYVVGRKK